MEPKASRPDIPGYGIVPADQGSGLKPWSYAVERLSRARGYWISTARPDGTPHSVPIWGVWLRDEFAFSTGAESRKVRNIAHNPRVVIGVEPADDAIVVEGTARLICDPSSLKEFAKLYTAKYDWKMEDFNEPVYSVKPIVAFSFNSTGDEFTAGSTRWTF